MIQRNAKTTSLGDGSTLTMMEKGDKEYIIFRIRPNRVQDAVNHFINDKKSALKFFADYVEESKAGHGFNGNASFTLIERIVHPFSEKILKEYVAPIKEKPMSISDNMLRRGDRVLWRQSLPFRHLVAPIHADEYDPDEIPDPHGSQWKAQGPILKGTVESFAAANEPNNCLRGVSEVAWEDVKNGDYLVFLVNVEPPLPEVLPPELSPLYEGFAGSEQEFVDWMQQITDSGEHFYGGRGSGMIHSMYRFMNDYWEYGYVRYERTLTSGLYVWRERDLPPSGGIIPTKKDTIVPPPGDEPVIPEKEEKIIPEKPISEKVSPPELTEVVPPESEKVLPPEEPVSDEVPPPKKKRGRKKKAQAIPLEEYA